MNKNPIWRGDIYRAKLDPVVGSEQNGVRPVLIVQNDIGNAHSPTTIVTPLTSNRYKNPMPTHLEIPKINGLTGDSLLLAEQIRTIDCSRLTEHIGHINNNDYIWRKINKALAVGIGLDKTQPRIINLCFDCVIDCKNSGYFVIEIGFQKGYKNCDICKHGRGLTFAIFY